MIKFKHGDIVVALNSISKLLPTDAVVQVRDARITKEYFCGDPFILEAINVINSVYVSIHYKYFGQLRLATQQEQFLYYIFGPHVLGEMNEQV